MSPQEHIDALATLQRRRLEESFAPATKLLDVGLGFTVLELRRYTRRDKPQDFSSSNGASEEDLVAARKWLSKFDAETIPKNICDVSFSRSSGPGGQNVNKVNSKATVRVPLDSLLPLVPSILHGELRTSHFYAQNTNSLLIQASESRKQQDNLQTCYRKLTQTILEAAGKVIPGETSVAQRERVKVLQKAENERRIKMKKAHSSKKSSRKGDRD